MLSEVLKLLLVLTGVPVLVFMWFWPWILLQSFTLSILNALFLLISKDYLFYIQYALRPITLMITPMVVKTFQKLDNSKTSPCFYRELSPNAGKNLKRYSKRLEKYLIEYEITDRISIIDAIKVMFDHNNRLNKPSQDLIERLLPFLLCNVYERRIIKYTVDNQLVAFALDFQYGHSLYAFMYFCRSEYAYCNIYQHIDYFSMATVSSTDIKYVIIGSGCAIGKQALGYKTIDSDHIW